MDERKFLSIVRQYDQLERRFRRDYSVMVASAAALYAGTFKPADAAEAQAQADKLASTLKREYVGQQPTITVADDGQSVIVAQVPYKTVAGRK